MKSMDSNTMEEKKKWYDRKWAVRLLLIIFYPVGLYGFIRGKKPVVTMILTTLLYGGFWVYVFIPSTPAETPETAVLQPDTQIENTGQTANEQEVAKEVNSSSAAETQSLYQAAEKGDLAAVKTLLKGGEKPYAPSYVRSGIPENDEPEKDSYYIALKNGHTKVAEEIYKHLSRPPYWAGREGILNGENYRNIIGFLSAHNIILPKDDVAFLVKIYNNFNNSSIDRQNTLPMLNYLALVDSQNKTYADFGIDLSPFLQIKDIWERVSFVDLSSFNQLAGNWEGRTSVRNPTNSGFEGTSFENAEIRVSLEAKFNRNIRKGNDKYFSYEMTAFYSDYLDIMITALAEETSTPKILLGGKKKELWQQMMSGVERKYNSANISGETKVKNHYVESKITLSAEAFESDFLKSLYSLAGIYMNPTKTKMKITFRESYISFLPVSSLEFELTKK